MTEAELTRYREELATHWEEEEWLTRYRQEIADQKAAGPPRHSSVKDPGGHRWCALLDGQPVGNCTEYDVDAGWVQVYVVKSTLHGRAVRILNVPQRRLYGVVTPVWVTEFFDLQKRLPTIEIVEGDPRGEPVPGTEIRLERHQSGTVP